MLEDFDKEDTNKFSFFSKLKKKIRGEIIFKSQKSKT